jgi:hypothetical protein
VKVKSDLVTIPVKIVILRTLTFGSRRVRSCPASLECQGHLGNDLVTLVVPKVTR